MTSKPEYVAAHRARAKAAGLVRVEVMIPKHRKEELKRLVNRWKKEAGENIALSGNSK
jgi:hypothetical protein